MVGKRIVRPDRAQLLPGSGIDLERSRPRTAVRTPAGGSFRSLLVGRLPWGRGIAEFVGAARIVRRSHADARFQMLSRVGATNRTAVPSSVLERWRAEGIIDYLGESDDAWTAMVQADCIAVPSYREGLPPALLEGLAMSKPLIAREVSGCRDVVEGGITGYLCAERSAESLAAAMVR